MVSLYRKALELIGKGWDWVRTYTYIRSLNPKESPNLVHRATTAALSGKQVAEWVSDNPGQNIEKAWETAPYVPYLPGVRYTNEDLRGIFPELVDAPYAVDIITNINGLNQTGFQRFIVYIYGGETWSDIRKDLLDAIKEEYEFTGKVTTQIVSSFVIGTIRP